MSPSSHILIGMSVQKFESGTAESKRFYVARTCLFSLMSTLCNGGEYVPEYAHRNISSKRHSERFMFATQRRRVF